MFISGVLMAHGLDVGVRVVRGMHSDGKVKDATTGQNTICQLESVTSHVMAGGSTCAAYYNSLSPAQREQL